MLDVDPKSLRRLVGALLLFQVTALFMRAWLQLSLERHGVDARAAMDASYLVVPVLLGILCWPLAQKFPGFLRSQLCAQRPTVRQVASAIAIAGLLRIAWWTSTLVGAGPDPQPSPVSVPLATAYPIVVTPFGCPSWTILALNLSVMALLVPIIEEIINRGYLLRALLGLGRPVAVVGSSLMFGIFHAPSMIIAASVCGVALAILALRSGSLWPPIVAHAAYNGLVALDTICRQVLWRPADIIGSAPLRYGLALTTIVSLAAAFALAARPGRR